MASQTSSIVELPRTISASLKSGSIPFLLKSLACNHMESRRLLLQKKRVENDLPLGVDTNQAKFFPASIYYVSDAEIKLAAHDDSVGFPC